MDRIERPMKVLPREGLDLLQHSALRPQEEPEERAEEIEFRLIRMAVLPRPPRGLAVGPAVDQSEEAAGRGFVGRVE